jgi:hypothetical protein
LDNNQQPRGSGRVVTQGEPSALRVKVFFALPEHTSGLTGKFMSYKSETIQAILPRINTTFFLPALQREFVWTADQTSALFDSLTPLHEWLATRSPEFLKRHFIPSDQSLWHIDKYENFLIERCKLLKARIQQVFTFDGEAG